MVEKTLPREAVDVGAQFTSIRNFERRLFIGSLLVIDALAIAMGFLLAYYLRFQSPWLPYYATFSPYFYYYVILFAVPSFLLIFATFGLYNEHYLLGGLQEYSKVTNACTTGMMVIIVFSFLYRAQPDISRGWLIISWLLVTLLAGSGRFCIRRLVYRMRRLGKFSVPVLIVGANEEGLAVAQQFQVTPTSGVKIIGFVDDSLSPGTEVFDGVRVLGPVASLESLIRRYGASEIVVASTGVSRNQLLDIFRSFGTSNGVNIRLSSGLFEILTTKVRVKEMGYVPLVSLDKVRITGWDLLFKTVLDYIFASIGLAVAAPFMILIGVLIKMDSPGPVLYRRLVVGQGKRFFYALKFRTMVTNASTLLKSNPVLRARWESEGKIRDDPRVTRVGRILRRASLDELPQLLNVLRGQMSLVGPRMISPPELEKFGKWQQNLLTVKPGITGLWQVSGRSDLSYEDRIRLDMHYIRNYTIWLDLHIVFRTIGAVLRGRGAY
jgi:exopolysaccharide biosynthesis polyprenyl glycosylphosphotransferase